MCYGLNVTMIIHEVINMKKKLFIVIITGVILFTADFINVTFSKRVLKRNINIQTISETYHIQDQMFSDATYIALTGHFFSSTKGYELINSIDDNYVRLRISKTGFMPRMKEDEDVEVRTFQINDTTMYTFFEYMPLPDSDECNYWITLNFHMNDTFYTYFISPISSALPVSITKGSALIDDVIMPYITNQMKQTIQFDEV